MNIKYCVYYGMIFRQIDNQPIEYMSLSKKWELYTFYPPKKIENFIYKPSGWTYRLLTETEAFIIML